MIFIFSYFSGDIFSGESLLVKGLCDFDVSYGGGVVPEQVDLRVQDRHAGRLRLAQR